MSHYHLYAIGNALVDTEYEVSDALLSAMGVSKRHMTLIDMPNAQNCCRMCKACTRAAPVAARPATRWWHWPNWAARLFTHAV